VGVGEIQELAQSLRRKEKLGEKSREIGKKASNE